MIKKIKSHLSGKLNYTTTAKNTTESLADLLTQKPYGRLLVSEFLSLLKENLYTRSKFPTSTSILDNRYSHLKSQYNNFLYPFHYQLDYILAHYFAELKIIQYNINEILSYLLIVSFTKKLFYKNVDEQIKKLLKISYGISENIQIQHTFDDEVVFPRVLEQRLQDSCKIW